MSGGNVLELDAATRQSLRHAVAVLGVDTPLPVVVVSDAYALLLDNWLAHFHQLGLSRVLIVAMDAALEVRLAGRGLLVARGVFDGSAADFWLRRMLIWRELVAMGIDIVQSDIDALWFKDPIKPFFLDQPFDFICSQGTLHPRSAAERWGFVLCTGFMAIRGNAPSKRFLDAVCRRGAKILTSDDQEVMNDLLGEMETVWYTDAIASRSVAFRGDYFYTAYASILPGHCAAFDLRIGLLPHDLFPRLSVPGADTYVKHLLRPENDARRISELRTAACWLVEDDADC